MRCVQQSGGDELASRPGTNKRETAPCRVDRSSRVSPPNCSVHCPEQVRATTLLSRGCCVQMGDAMSRAWARKAVKGMEENGWSWCLLTWRFVRSSDRQWTFLCDGGCSLGRFAAWMALLSIATLRRVLHFAELAAAELASSVAIRRLSMGRGSGGKWGTYTQRCATQRSID